MSNDEHDDDGVVVVVVMITLMMASYVRQRDARLRGKGGQWPTKKTHSSPHTTDTPSLWER
eukprot:217664-Prorocentrum_lima.AAC.1